LLSGADGFWISDGASNLISRGRCSFEPSPFGTRIDPFCAALARQHNDSNVLCLGGKIIGPAIAMEIVKTWMHTEPLTAEKYRRRVRKVQEIDAKHCVAVH